MHTHEIVVGFISGMLYGAIGMVIMLNISVWISVFQYKWRVRRNNNTK